MFCLRSLLAFGAFGLLASPFAQTHPADFVPLHKSPPKAILQAKSLGNKPKTDVLHIAFSLPPADARGFKKFADAVSDPKSPQYRKFIGPAEVGRRFGLPQTEIDKVTQYLRGQSIAVKRVTQNRLSILADATVAQAESLFHVSIQRFSVTPTTTDDDGIRFSFTTTPTLPPDIVGDVQNVSGLEDFTRPKPCNPTPQQLAALYSVAPLQNAGSKGQGRIVAISNFDGFRLANEVTECQHFNLPVPSAGASKNISIIPVDGGFGQNATENAEGDLDIQAAIGMAPLCNLVIYDDGQAGGLGHDLIDLLTQEAEDNLADIVTESYGWNLDAATAIAAHNIHLSMTAQGMTYLAAAGDHGTDYSNGFYYPQNDPEVLTVGGTSVQVDSLGNRISEVGWNNDNGWAGGGGWIASTDVFNVRPPYQLTPAFIAQAGVPSLNAAPHRLIPDVSLNADPNTGYSVFLEGTWQVWGGTSGASPATAAALADVEQQLIADGYLTADAFGHFRLGRVQDLLYSYNGDSTVFFDIVSGTNGNLPNNNLSAAVPGWDTDSGWGSTNFAGLVTKFENTPVLASVALNPSTVIGSSSTTGTVTLRHAAPTGGAVVALSSSDTTVATVPSSVTVPAGETQQTFTVHTTQVSTVQTPTISANLGELANALLVVNPFSISTLTVNPTSVIGGSSCTGTVTLPAKAPAGGIVVFLSSNNAAATVPASVTVPSGATTTTFTITTTGVQSNVVATITAALTQNGTGVTAQLTIQSAALASISIAPQSVYGGSQTVVVGTVTLNGLAGPGGVTVQLNSSIPGVASVPASVTVKGNSNSATFIVTTAPVTSDYNPVISATFNDVTVNTRVTVRPFGVATLSFSPQSVVGGLGSVGTVTINESATSAISVSLTSNSQDAIVPASAIIPAGSTVGNFQIKTLGVLNSESVLITAMIGESGVGTHLTLLPASMGSLSVVPSLIPSGTSAVGTIALTGLAPSSSGFTVQLTSSNPKVVVPPTVTIASQTSSVQFTVSAGVVTSSTLATITARAPDGTTLATRVTVVPSTLASIKISPTSFVGGSSTSVFGIVYLNGIAPPTGLTVALTSSNKSAASVPATVKIASGFQTATFTLIHSLVTTSQTVTIKASLGSTSVSQSVSVQPFAVTALSLSPTSVLGGVKVTGLVTLNATAGAKSGAIKVKLASSSKYATVPSTVSVPVNASSENFTVTTTGVPSTTVASITGTLGSSSKTASLTINAPVLLTLGINPATVKGSASTKVTGTVTISGPAPTGGMVVALSSSNTAAATVPASVTIAAGKTAATFTVTHKKVTAQAAATINAKLNGVTKTATLTVTPG